MPDHDHVGLDHRAVTEADPGHPAVPLEAGHGDPAAEIDAVVEVEAGAGRAQFRRERPGQRRGQRLEHGHVDAPHPGRGGHLGADEPGADDAQARRGRLELGPEREALVERAQHVDAGQVLACRATSGAWPRWR